MRTTLWTQNLFRRKMESVILCITVILFSCFLFGACKNSNAEVKKIKDLEFTVVQDADVPEELMKIIEQKKEQPFEFSYTDSEYLYIAIGYGQQNTGGYSITVDDLFLTKNAIYVDTTLMGPKKNEVVTQALTYPYIVIKLERMDKSVVFE
ncbi:protease complex subunit PrcB family protein [Anaeromicropila herbilytica]|uniref:PrcB C-terminal domain-containing protein n=1 Tax=Anaeromicropila herbilytica TaxID=2785025 RepID=A0A7R7EHF4_9FIRM|nr:protease complex subunit PrcB family protein [Anaeromicropila herbilytica]BCN28783.1 hypothetical protein bsdtb5_00780 [Anaeromicropila herbilytica]